MFTINSNEKKLETWNGVAVQDNKYTINGTGTSTFAYLDVINVNVLDTFEVQFTVDKISGELPELALDKIRANGGALGTSYKFITKQGKNKYTINIKDISEGFSLKLGYFSNKIGSATISDIVIKVNSPNCYNRHDIYTRTMRSYSILVANGTPQLVTTYKVDDCTFEISTDKLSIKVTHSIPFAKKSGGIICGISSGADFKYDVRVRTQTTTDFIVEYYDKTTSSKVDISTLKNLLINVVHFGFD